MGLTNGSRQTDATGLYQGAEEIRSGGNSTWDMPKKGDCLRLAPPGAAVSGMAGDRAWVLLANDADKPSMRAAVGFELFGVLTVGTLSLLEPSWFPDQTVWSSFGAGYGWLPLVLPFLGVAWLLRTRPAHT